MNFNLTLSLWASSSEAVAWYESTSRVTVCLAIAITAFSYLIYKDNIC